MKYNHLQLQPSYEVEVNNCQPYVSYGILTYKKDDLYHDFQKFSCIVIIVQMTKIIICVLVYNWLLVIDLFIREPYIVSGIGLV